MLMNNHEQSSSQINLATVVESVPGKVRGAATACDVSVRAVYKWISAGRLPRTDYTGETAYAKKLAEATGCRYSASEILSCSKNNIEKG